MLKSQGTETDLRRKASKAGTKTKGEQMTRAKATELINIIHNNVRDAFIQNNLFWQFQEVIRQNERLAVGQNEFLYLVNQIFEDSIIMAVRRQLDGHRGCVSLRRLLQELHASPSVTGGHLTAEEIQQDIDNLNQQYRSVRGFADRRVAHTDPQQLSDGHPTFRDVQNCIQQLCELVNKYSVMVSDEPLSVLPPTCGTGWKEIFTFPWLETEEVPRGLARTGGPAH